jgi:plasmid stability protein
MKDITLSADESLIKAVRRRAAAEGTTLEALLRQCMADYVERGRQADRAMAAIRELRETIDTGGRRFTRDEMNER